MNDTKPAARTLPSQDNAHIFDPCHARILLVKPRWLWGESYEASPPMGLLYISSSLKKKFPGIDIRLLDLRLEHGSQNENLARVVESFKPHIVGFLGLTGDQPQLTDLSQVVKSTDPVVHVCCGGPYPTHCPEDFQDMPHIDSIVRGEGEISFGNLVEHLSTGDVSDIPKSMGFSIRKSNGRLHIPGYSPVIQDLDQLPYPDWTLIDPDKYAEKIQINIILAGKRPMPVFSSRGCPFQCMYCHNIFGKKVRLRSAESVVDEIEILVKQYGVDEIQFYDDIFNVDRDRVFKICDLIIQRRLNITFCFPNAIRGDMADDEMILKLKEAGAYMITFAIETASKRIQKLIRKNLDIDKTIRAIRTANRCGLLTRGYFMIGFPTETEDELKKTIRLPSHLPLTTISFFSVIPFKGTALYDLAHKHTNHNGRQRLEQPSHTYFTSSTYYSATTGINMSKYLFFCYFMFFTPWRLLRYFIKLPRKALYMRQVLAILKIGFLTGRKKYF